MTDRELLELAAKAAGIDVRRLPDAWPERFDDDQWDPLIDDGDALRLAVKLNIDLLHSWMVVNGDDNYPMASICVVQHDELLAEELKESDPYAATRRAIVRAAAEIGKEMK